MIITLYILLIIQQVNISTLPHLTRNDLVRSQRCHSFILYDLMLPHYVGTWTWPGLPFLCNCSSVHFRRALHFLIRRVKITNFECVCQSISNNKDHGNYRVKISRSEGDLSWRAESPKEFRGYPPRFSIRVNKHPWLDSDSLCVSNSLRIAIDLRQLNCDLPREFPHKSSGWILSPHMNLNSCFTHCTSVAAVLVP